MKRHLFIACAILTQVQLILSFSLHIPLRARTEGRLELSYWNGERYDKHQFSFSETIDVKFERYKVAIGYISHAPVIYYKSVGNPIITSKDGLCQAYDSKTLFIPELSWFAELMLPWAAQRQGLGDYLYLVGPTGLHLVLAGLSDGEQLSLVGQKRRRNIPSELYSRRLKVPEKGLLFKVDVYIAESLHDQPEDTGVATGLFSIVVSAVKGNDINQITSSTVFDYIYSMDMISVDEIVESQTELSKFDYEFGVPLAVGCSEHLGKTDMELTSHSFSMFARQWSRGTDVMVAYDGKLGLLRRETIGGTTSIWDMQKDRLFHIDNYIERKVSRQARAKNLVVSPCSVLDVSSMSSPAFKPYKISGKSLDVLDFLGAQQLAFMGSGFMRSAPCHVYETILQQPPSVFGRTSTDGHLGDKPLLNKDRLDYIVQFWMQSQPVVYGSRPHLDASQFQLVQIVLYKRDKSRSGTAVVEFMDLIEVKSFHWSLYGWDRRPVDMFTASECYDEESEQVKVELAFRLDNLTGGGTLDQKQVIDHNKFKLEYDLTNMLADAYKLSRMHISDQEMSFSRDMIDVDLVIADRREVRKLSFLISGWLAGNCKDTSFCAEFSELKEEDCISVVSFIKDANFLAYCPSKQGNGKCLAFLSNTFPAVGSRPESGDAEEACEVFEFAAMVPEATSTAKVSSNQNSLLSESFTLLAVNPTNKKLTAQFRAKVEHFDVDHYVKVTKVPVYKYLSPSTSSEGASLVQESVWSFDNMEFKNIGDCIKLCNLDTRCRSYSYCPAKGGQSCVLSRLDIRSNELQSQLLSANPERLDGKLRIEVHDEQSKYTLEMEMGCDIYEKEYLGAFSKTGEFVSIPESIAKQIATTSNTFGCARKAIEHEASGNQVGSFAYCFQTNTCLLDESLFLKDTSGVIMDEDETKSENEILCNVFKRRYQTFFHVSSLVLEDNSGDQRLGLTTNSVEDCARACWQQFGNICNSFDYCKHGECAINRGVSGSSKLKRKAGCLHYERDSNLEKLRHEHLDERHQPLAGRRLSFLSFCIFLILSGAFTVGLVLGNYMGQNLFDQLQFIQVVANLKQRGRKSNTAESVEPMNDEPRPGSSNQKINVSNEALATNDIQLSVIKRDVSHHLESIDEPLIYM